MPWAIMVTVIMVTKKKHMHPSELVRWIEANMINDITKQGNELWDASSSLGPCHNNFSSEDV